MTAARASAPAVGRPWFRAGMLVILILAFALRAYQLDGQSLWSDEGISLQRAQMALPAMLDAMPAEHLPGYFVLLNGWVLLAGEQDVALRFLSLWPSVLAVALLARLALVLAEPQLLRAPVAVTISLAAALLLATGSFQLWYAQEARMYSWLLAMSLLSSLALWRLVVRPAGHLIAWGVLYAVATAACVYLHFYGALTPIAQSVFVFGWALTHRDWRGLGRWLLASTGALLLFLPWLPRSLAIFGFGGWREAGDPAEIPWRYLAAFTIGDAMPEPLRTPLAWVYVLLATAGIWTWWRLRRGAALYLLATILVPTTAVLLLAVRNPDYHERYAIAVSAPLILACAGGVGALDARTWTNRAPARRLRYAALPLLTICVLAAANLVAAQRYYNDSTLHKPDYRGAADTIAAALQPGDVILVDGPDPEKVFLHYYTGDAPVFAVTDLQSASLEEADRTLRDLTAGAHHVWELLYFHAPATVQVWLATQAWATDPTYHNDIRVTRYGLSAREPVSIPLDVDFAGVLTLQNAELDTLSPHAGELLRVSTNWFTDAQAPEYKFSLRLTDAAGTLVQSVDYTPQNWFAPTNAWIVGQPARDQRGLLLPRDLAPGEYRLTLRLYDPTDGVPVATNEGEDVLLATLAILAPEGPQ